MNTPALSQYTYAAVPLAQRSAAAAAITTSYTQVGTNFGRGVVFLILVSTLDQAVQLSFDGITDHIALNPSQTIYIDLKSAQIVLPGHFGIWVKEIGNPGSGNLYVNAFGVE